MPDGTGDEYGAPGLTLLKQMSWDLGYIRDKLVLNNVSKTLVWQRSGMRHKMVLGLIVSEESNFLAALRNLAEGIATNKDGPAPVVTDFGQSNWSQTQLNEMYNGLYLVGSRIMSEKRTFTMRLAGLADSNVELTLGDAKGSHASYRTAIKTLATQITNGLG